MRSSKSLPRLITERLLLAISLALVARTLVNIYAIPSSSMEPTLRAGDTIIVVPYRFSEPSRGDVVVFRSSGAELRVKRVVAGPGELIDSRAGRIRVGGYTLAEPYLVEPAASGAISAQLVPSRSYFVLGDNRSNSIDSRSWGPLSRDAILGEVHIILASSAFERSRAAHAAGSRTETPSVSYQPRPIFQWID